MKKILLSIILTGMAICQPQIGDECYFPNGEIGIIDCTGDCIYLYIWGDNILDWIGDEYCDHLTPVNFSCYEFGFDCGACSDYWDGSDPLGFCSEDCVLAGGGWGPPVYDINPDGVINVLDILSTLNCILLFDTNLNCACGDTNQDGSVNVQDIVMMVNIILS